MNKIYLLVVSAVAYLAYTQGRLKELAFAAGICVIFYFIYILARRLLGLDKFNSQFIKDFVSGTDGNFLVLGNKERIKLPYNAFYFNIDFGHTRNTLFGRIVRVSFWEKYAFIFACNRVMYMRADLIEKLRSCNNIWHLPHNPKYTYHPDSPFEI